MCVCNVQCAGWPNAPALHCDAWTDTLGQWSHSLSLNHPRSVSMRREHPVPQSQQHAAEKKWLAIYECINKNEISLTSPIIRCVTFNLCLKCAISAFLRYGGSLFRDHLVAGAYFPIRCNYGVESAMAVNGYSSRTAAAEAYNKFENNNAQHTHNTRRIIVICKKSKTKPRRARRWA